MKKITIQSKKLKEVINLTLKIKDLLEKFPAKDGMLHLYLKHSTAALTTAYLEGDLDVIGAFEIIIPTSSLAKEHTHHIGYLPAHVIASMFGPHLAIPVVNNKLTLGKFQSVALIELNGPRKREILINYNKK